ncbi:hypothetical protein DY000_02063383 [Brassica cretica]|uniref:Uncharacterized protein n=1 Tax=Brassica cretica TaxID=69181 RepID=A0ABQ7B2H6_BRACR|nr:hypothetical protein DY000_02063383 [Brassica cretica]
MSLLRQVLQPLLQHDPRTPPRASLSLYKISLSVSVSIQTTPELSYSYSPCSRNPSLQGNIYSLALQVYTTPTQHLNSTWSSPLNPTSTSATTSATTSG